MPCQRVHAVTRGARTSVTSALAQHLIPFPGGALEHFARTWQSTVAFDAEGHGTLEGSAECAVGGAAQPVGSFVRGLLHVPAL